MWYNELELESYIEQQAISHIWYNELELESIIDEFFQPKIDKIEKIQKVQPIQTPLNQVFKQPDMRDIIFGFQKTMLKDNLKSIKKKCTKSNNNTKFVDIGDLKIGDRYFNCEINHPQKIYEVIRITAKSVQGCEMIPTKIPIKDDPPKNNVYRTGYYKYTNELDITKKDMRRKTTGVMRYIDNNIEIYNDDLL